jgi:hypothetical protein
MLAVHPGLLPQRNSFRIKPILDATSILDIPDVDACMPSRESA